MQPLHRMCQTIDYKLLRVQVCWLLYKALRSSLAQPRLCLNYVDWLRACRALIPAAGFLRIVSN